MIPVQRERATLSAVTTETANRRKRADAVRNQARILSAAGRIVEDHGVEALAMADVAIAAGVGVGTLYRSFGDRSGLARALVDAREREFQEAFVSGEPPLGPGAEPLDRIRAFLDALADRTLEQLDLLLMAETATPLSRFGGAYGAYRTHLTLLLSEFGIGGDTRAFVDALLAPLAASLLEQQKQDEIDAEQIKRALNVLVDGVAMARESEGHSSPTLAGS